MSDKAKKILKIVISVIIAALTALGTALGLNSCNAVRTIYQESSFVQKGDTIGVIQSKCVESYDADKKVGL